MNLLYLSCHSVLEYDEIKLFSELGIDVFSDGVYHNPQKIDDPKRPILEAKYHPELEVKLTKTEEKIQSPEAIAWADVIMVMHRGDYLQSNWANFKRKRVIWRSIGQSSLNVENILRPMRAEGLEIVRYSPREQTIPGFVGEDAMIRFYKDPSEFKGWTGTTKQVLTVGQDMKYRKDFCNFDIFEETTREWPRKLLGTHKDHEDPMCVGRVDYEALKKAYRESRAYFYTGTYPASYTLNFIEAWMTGTPVVALGKRLGNSPFELGQNTYEVPDFLDETAGGLYADSVEDLRNHVKILMEDPAFAAKISEKGRQGAIKYFGKAKIKEEWRKFLNV